MDDSASPDESAEDRRLAIDERRIALDERRTQYELENQRATREIDERRISLDEQRTEYELENQRAARESDERNKEADRKLRRFEIANQTRGITAPQAVALGALMTLFGGAIGAALTGYFNRSVEQERSIGIAQLEKQKFETSLITDALKANNPLRAIPILNFYAVAGLLPNYGTSVLSLVQGGGLKFPVNLDSEQNEMAVFLSKNIISTCLRALEANKDDTSRFVSAVASQYGLHLSGLADDIVDQIQSAGWEVLPDGIAAAARARAGYFVIGGIKGQAQSVPAQHGHVVIVVDGPLAAGRYPTAFWGSLRGVPGERSTIDWAWTQADRDHVIYAARPLGITVAQ